MAINKNSFAYMDGDFTQAVAIGPVRWESPFPGVADSVDRSGNVIHSYILKQDFMQFVTSFVPLPMNTLHPDYLYHGLVEESPRQGLDGALCKWTRTYAAVPVTRFDGSSMAYTYPQLNKAYTTTGGVTSQVTLSDVRNLVSACNIQYDYFVTGSGGAGFLPIDYALATSIPVYQHQRFTISITNGAMIVGLQDTLILTDSGVIGVAVTSPTTTAYQANVASGAFSLLSQDSTLSRWRGNIYQRVSKYIKWQ